MSIRYKGSLMSSTAATTSMSAALGIWRLTDQLQAQNAGLWPRAGIILATYLVVAGGGAGGAYYYGGGGGAGGLTTNNGGTAFTIAPGSGAYTVTVGAGGTGSAGTPTNGNASSLIGTGLSISTVGGGRGGSYYSGNPGSLSGGSGGGGGAPSGTGSAGTAGQGYAGANGGGYGGGGGGSVAAGTSGAGITSPAGQGGAGTNLASLISPTLATSSSVGYISGAEVQFAGGGGGGEDANNGALIYQEQGQAGGVQGDTYINGAIALAGQAYTGSGGGGACHVGNSTETSGNGGKGVVIIQYPGTAALATGGDIIDITGGYVTHIFKNSGSFTPGY